MEIGSLLRFNRQRTVLDRRADRISDPIERLRFLRTQTCNGLSVETPRQAWWRHLFRQQAWAVASLMILSASFMLSRVTSVPEIRPTILPPPLQIPSVSATHPSGVWLVDAQDGVELYSNGLRIDSHFAVANIPRRPYRVFPREQADLRHARIQTGPAGIVFHTTESVLAPFEELQNKNLRRISVEVLNLVRTNHSYHYVIDRFGRVFRIVKETEVAYHAGHSTWADESSVYVNLNTAFLSVAFETQTQTGSSMPTATPAQIDAARVLTELLRQKYRIQAENCVTHAQVSVNPSNHRIGYHTDWADKFPFIEVGLRDNYSQAPASIFAFGFEYDPAFVASTGARLLPGLLRAEEHVAKQAAAMNRTESQYRITLQKNYREIAGDAPAAETAQEITTHEK